MAKELIDILKAAAEVRDETALQQNTATRVGSVLTDLANFVGEAVFAAALATKTNLSYTITTNARITFSIQDQTP